MKALTLKQPYASLIAEGIKKYAFKLSNIKKIDNIPANRITF